MFLFANACTHLRNLKIYVILLFAILLQFIMPGGRKMKKSNSLKITLCIILIISILCGCGGKENQKTSNNTPNSNGVPLFVCSGEYETCLIDKDGNIVECIKEDDSFGEYAKIISYLPTTGPSVKYDTQTFKFGYVDKSGSYVIEPKYDYADIFSENGLAMAFYYDMDAGETKYQFIDEKGNVIIALDDGVSAQPFYDNKAAKVFDSYEHYGAINAKGEYVIPLDVSHTGIAISGDYILLRKETIGTYVEDKKFNILMDYNGNIIEESPDENTYYEYYFGNIYKVVKENSDTDYYLATHTYILKNGQFEKYSLKGKYMVAEWYNYDVKINRDDNSNFQILVNDVVVKDIKFDEYVQFNEYLILTSDDEETCTIFDLKTAKVTAEKVPGKYINHDVVDFPDGYINFGVWGSPSFVVDYQGNVIVEDNLYSSVMPITHKGLTSY